MSDPGKSTRARVWYHRSGWPLLLSPVSREVLHRVYWATEGRHFNGPMHSLDHSFYPPVYALVATRRNTFDDLVRESVTGGLV